MDTNISENFLVVDRINEVLAERVKSLMFSKGISQADVARSIGEKPQTFGNYVRGRTIPAHVLRQWKAVYKEDLERLAETATETTVSRETTHDPWDTVDKLVDAIAMTTEDHRSEVKELRKDKDRLYELLLRYAPDAPEKKVEHKN